MPHRVSSIVEAHKDEYEVQAAHDASTCQLSIQLNCYHQKWNCIAQTITFAGSSKAPEMKELLCQKIGDAINAILKGKQLRTKSRLLIELLLSGLMFHGEGVPILVSMHCDYVSNLFCAWKLVKAGDVAPAGAFRNSTIYGLSLFFIAMNLAIKGCMLRCPPCQGKGEHWMCMPRR